ncbi:MAG TPA: GNAT family N-acetyltransferase [Acidimicrobiia bacterium]|jgi:GNAT superfamily N-acetyltransferase
MRRSLGAGYELDDDPARLDVDAVHRFLVEESYWARGRGPDSTRAVVASAARVVGLYAPDGAQAGFARVVSDDTSFAWLADVFVLPDHRGRGLGVELVREAVEGGTQAHLHWLLGTRDAHGLYGRFGFGTPSERILERHPTPVRTEQSSAAHRPSESERREP